MVLPVFFVALALVVAAAVLAVVRGVGLWRRVKRTGGAFTAELAAFEERAARTERLLEDADRSSRELELALERLRVSRARLEVLRRSVDQAGQRMRWIRAFLPV